MSSSDSLVKKLHGRYRKRKLGQKYLKKLSKQTSFLTYFHQFIHDLQSPKARFSSYTIKQLEPICRQMAMQRMSSSSRSMTTCPWVCLFCENFIYEPLTLICGHTYCERCVKDEDTSHCLRCSNELQGQIPSSIVYARETIYNKNHFLNQILERSETLKNKRESTLSYYQGQNYYANKDYQQALDIYSQILEKNKDNHLALYGRSKVHIALKQLPEALDDIERVVLLKPHWGKGYYSRSEILFEMQQFTAALLSSLQGLTLDPEDLNGKRIMARHLHAVLHNTNNEECTGDMQKESNDTMKEIETSDENDSKLLMCRSTQSTSCLCTSFSTNHLSPRDFECSICVNLLWSPVTTPCGHVFCRECLIRSIDNTQAQCPMCKTALDDDNDFFPLLIQSHVNTTEIIEQMIETYLPKEFSERKKVYEQENIPSESIPGHIESTVFEIPIFVCVLSLPHCTCPLHVFEPRYRLMMRRTMESQSRTFGMCKYDEQTDLFSEYGTLLYIRGLVYTPDGRSIVDTIGQRRFRVIDRGTRDGYCTARVQLIQDHPIEQEEFNDLVQLNQNTYKRVRSWFNQLNVYQRTVIARQLEDYPPCDDLTEGSADGPSWAWIMLNLLPIEPDLQYTALASQSFRERLQMINDTMDFLLGSQPSTASTPDKT